MNIPRPENESYDSHARRCDRNDIWTQVKRTVNGRPLPQEQISLIIETVAEMLELSPSDVLLDICCGNGALTHHWFARCAGGVGIDASPYLIEVANERFASGTTDRYIATEALSHIRASTGRSDFTKAVCYGSLQYFSRERAGELLAAINGRYPRLERLVVGNIPDLDRAAHFFSEGIPDASTLASPRSQIGVWYSEAEFGDLAWNAGWHCRVRRMPECFHAAHYRFDAILTPRFLSEG